GGVVVGGRGGGVVGGVGAGFSWVGVGGGGFGVWCFGRSCAGCCRSGRAFCVWVSGVGGCGALRGHVGAGAGVGGHVEEDHGVVLCGVDGFCQVEFFFEFGEFLVGVGAAGG